jgi:Leucine-rich repeat (LRR) protein
LNAEDNNSKVIYEISGNMEMSGNITTQQDINNMVTITGDNYLFYSTGSHPEVKLMNISRDVGDFFKGERFPNLHSLYLSSIDRDRKIVLECSALKMIGVTFATKKQSTLKIICSSVVKMRVSCSESDGDYVGNPLELLVLDCPSLQDLNSMCYALSRAEANCPSLKKLFCGYNNMEELTLNCGQLEDLDCSGNPLISINGLETCSRLKVLNCPSHLIPSVKIIARKHFPDVQLYCEEDPVDLNDD